MFLSRKPGVKWTNRGNPSTWDYTKADFTVDYNYHLKDISAIVGKGRKLVSFFVSAQGTVQGGMVMLFDPDSTNHFNKAGMYIPTSGYVCQTLWAYTNVNGEIGYNISANPAMGNIEIVVNGWLD